MQPYVLGFAFDHSGTRVLLIQKKRPAFQAGRWNGVGGKIEPGEAPVEAMVREFAEETGLIWPSGQWQAAGTYGDGVHFEIHLFGTQGDIQAAQSLTDEAVAVHLLSNLANLDLVNDVARQLDHLKTYDLPTVER
jgi:8-oxo-dGTP diphosphatase